MWPAGEPSLRTKYVTLDDGLSIRVIEGGMPAGRPVLLVHGWGGCVYSFREMMPPLADAGYRVLAMDLPGLGLSSKPESPAFYTLDAMSRVVGETATKLGCDRFAFVGHSMGGAIGLSLARQKNSRVESVVLINSVGLGRAPLMRPVRALTPGPIERLLPPVMRSLTINLILRLAFATKGRPTDRDIDEYWAPTQFPEMMRACRLLAHHFDFGPLPDDALKALKVPVLAVGTGRDRMVHGSAERARLIPGARVLAFEECGHLAMQECADRVNPAIVEFLKSAA
jgi:pimeloyl-ACP methyl ester carboxylesterase